MGFGGILVIFRFRGYFGNLFGFWGYFGHFLGFGDILVIFWVSGVMIPSKISKLVSIERWWSQGLILKTNNKSKGTGQKSFDDEVSKLIILGRERDLFWKISVWMSYLCTSECLYSIHGTVIISIIVPLVKEFITAMEVMIFELAFHKQ